MDRGPLVFLQVVVEDKPGYILYPYISPEFVLRRVLGEVARDYIHKLMCLSLLVNQVSPRLKMGVVPAHEDYFPFLLLGPNFLYSWLFEVLK